MHFPSFPLPGGSAFARVLAFALFPGASAFLLAAPAPVDPRIFAGSDPGASESFLVVLRDDADLSGASAIADRTARIRFVREALVARAETSQAPLLARLSEAGVPYRSFFLVNMVEVEGTSALAEEISRRPEVSSVAANPRIARSAVPAAPPEEKSAAETRAVEGAEPNLVKIGATDVWSRGFTGQGMVIAIADTGTTWEHPALRPHYRGVSGGTVSHDYNWHDAIHDPLPGNPCGASSAVPCDDNGHGTGTAGVSVGDDGAGNAIGVAPGARWIGCRNMDRNVGTPARYTECFQWFLSPTDGNGANPRPDLAPDVINNSWACPTSEGCTDPNVLRGVIENVTSAGIFVAVAAGNSGPACDTTTDVPSFYAASFTVGATTLTDTIASFSSRGPATADGSGRLKPDLSAPGVNIRTSSPAGYQVFSGTSAATPHVAGAVALLWSAVPALARDIPATIAVLERTAVPLTSTQDCAGFPGAQVPNAVFGWGRLDVAAAVTAALTPPAIARTEPVRPARTVRPAKVVAPRNPQ